MLQPTIQQAFDLALQHHQAGRLQEAEDAYRQVLARQPHCPQAYNNLGKVLRDKGELDKAIGAYRQAIHQKPDLPEAHNNLGNALIEKHQIDEAIQAYRHAIALNPRYGLAHSNLANALKANGQLDEAIAAFQQAIALRPGYAPAYNSLGNAIKDQGRLDEAVAAYRQAILLDPSNAAFGSNLLYTLSFLGGYDPHAMAEEFRGWNRLHAEPLAKLIQAHSTGSRQAHSNEAGHKHRLRIGYVSPDFDSHPVGRFMLPLMANHDHAGFEIFCYSSVRRPDEITHRLRASADVWRDISDLSDQDAANLIRSDKIDILIDLTMHMGNNRMLIFAQKPAPVQAAYLAYAGTTGLAAMDYRLIDPYLAPPNTADEYCTEKSVQLAETYWCYEPPVDDTPSPTPPALRAGHIVFGCLNNFCKITPQTWETWLRILPATPDSRLIIHAVNGSHRQNVRDKMKAAGIDPGRIEFVDRLSPMDYMNQYKRIDIALDPFPCVGGTTTCDALWMGVPVVTLGGKTALSRGGVSILSNLGITELIAKTPEEYVGIAVALAGDLPRLGQLRSTLRRRMQQSPLMDAPRFTRNIEAAYRQMWQNCHPTG